jgi:hypothetical protein
MTVLNVLVRSVLLEQLFPVTYSSVCKPRCISPVGSATTLYCALCPDIVNKSGAHFADCAEETFYLHPTATDPKLAEALWKASEEIVNKT